MDNPVILLVVALIAAMALSNFNLILGAVAGILITLGVGVWGWTAIGQGKVIAFLGAPLSKEVFLAFVGAITVINVVQLVRGIRSRKR